MKEIIFVGLGGLTGSVSRYAVQLLMSKYIEDQTHWATVVVNLVGCLLIGVFAGSLLKLNQAQNFLLITGFCGGFTTFSTFAFDGIKLLKAGLYVQFITYFSISTIGGMVLCIIGFLISSK